LLFFLGVSSSSTLGLPLVFLICLTRGPAAFLAGGFYRSTSSASLEPNIL
jgi:hypothetical protein